MNVIFNVVPIVAVGYLVGNESNFIFGLVAALWTAMIAGLIIMVHRLVEAYNETSKHTVEGITTLSHGIRQLVNFMERKQ